MMMMMMMMMMMIMIMIKLVCVIYNPFDVKRYVLCILFPDNP